MARISAVVITLNEEKKITGCLNSIKDVVDEILVVDSFSSDKTVEICKRFDAKVVQHKWEGYSGTKNHGNRLVSNDYILSIDADEELSAELQDSIKSAKKGLSGAYSFNRLTNYCGQWIHYCGWYPDKKVRIFNRNDAFWNDSSIHENLQFKNQVSLTHLNGDLHHYSFLNLADHLKTINKYSELAAIDIINKHKKFLYLKLLITPAFKFVSSYFLKRGFRDGFYGFCVCVFSAFDVFARYAKAIQLKKQKAVATEK
jgi:glycosyltransferase involved in cell wall biosynthesis